MQQFNGFSLPVLVLFKDDSLLLWESGNKKKTVWNGLVCLGGFDLHIIYWLYGYESYLKLNYYAVVKPPAQLNTT